MHGRPYADIEAHGCLDGEITRLNELRLTALEARIDADIRAGKHSHVIGELEALQSSARFARTCGRCTCSRSTVPAGRPSPYERSVVRERHWSRASGLTRHQRCRIWNGAYSPKIVTCF